LAHIGFDARLAGVRRGGIATYATHLTPALAPVLAARGHRLTVYHAPGATLALPEGARGATLRTPPHNGLEQVALPAELARTRPDLVHHPDFIPTQMGRWGKVITVHDLDFLRQPHRLAVDARKYYAQIRWAVRVADAIIAPSSATRDDLHSLLGVPGERVTVIPEAAGPEFRPPAPDDPPPVLPPGCPPAGSYFLFVGTVEPRKNLDTLLAAHRAYRSQSDDPRDLVIVGVEGWESERTANLLQRSPGVHWLADVGGDALPALFRGAIALLLPSWDEGFGLTVLEAMASGTPVAISSARALEEVAGGAALVAPPDEHDAWAMLLHTLAAFPNVRDDLRRRGLKRAAHFTWHRAAEMTADVYEQVLAASGERRAVSK